MARAKRGGKRAGAGRKPVLTGENDRLWIGGRCEDLWRAECRKASDAASAKATAIVQVEYAKLRAVPVPERKKFQKSQAWKDYLDDFRFALQTQQATLDDSEPRDHSEPPDDIMPGALITVSAPRPKGKRKSIIAQVSAEGTTRYGVKISMRLVEACWKEFRREQDILAQQGE